MKSTPDDPQDKLPPSVRERWEARKEEYEREQKLLEAGSSDDTQEVLIKTYPGLYGRST